MVALWATCFLFGFWGQYDFGYSVPVHLSFLLMYFACSRTANDMAKLCCQRCQRWVLSKAAPAMPKFI